MGKGKQNHFKNTPYIVTWIDLLGYGSMLAECAYDPTSKQAEQAVKRLEEFNHVSLVYANPRFPILQMNDGIAAWRELSFRDKSVTQDFLRRSIEFFYAVKESEMNNGFPGPRMVISSGIQMKMTNLHREVAKARAERLIADIKEGITTYDNAIYEACNYNDFCNGVNALQANFAFTKSYLAEDSGKAYGLYGCNIYIDMNIFNDSKIKCIELDKPFLWEKYPGLETRFSRVANYNKDIYNKYSKDEIASTLIISKRLLKSSEQNDVIERLRSNN